MDWMQQWTSFLDDLRIQITTIAILLAAYLQTGSIEQTQVAAGYRDLGEAVPISVEYTTLYDAMRDEEIPLKVYYPHKNDPSPVILFSHGAGGSCETATDLSLQWASQGYICIHPSHLPDVAPDAAFSMERFLLELRDLYASGGPPYWADRIGDLTYILDHFAELEWRLPVLAGQLDASRIAVGGHSLGAYTAMLIGGTILYHPEDGSIYDYGDPRVKAFLALSAPGAWDGLGVAGYSWDAVTIPMMFVSGSEDPGMLGEDPQWRLEGYIYSPSLDKYSLYIDGATHISYVGFSLGAGQEVPAESLPPSLPDAGILQRLLDASADQDEIMEYAMIAGLAFWDAHLKGSSVAATYLDTDLIGWYRGGKAHLERSHPDE